MEKSVHSVQGIGNKYDFHASSDLVSLSPIVNDSEDFFFKLKMSQNKAEYLYLLFNCIHLIFLDTKLYWKTK